MDLGLAAYLRQEQLARLRGKTWRQEELLPRQLVDLNARPRT